MHTFWENIAKIYWYKPARAEQISASIFLFFHLEVLKINFPYPGKLQFPWNLGNL
jgi:hypothetical protein